MRLLEQQEHKKEQFQEQRQQYMSKTHDIAKRNETLLEQLRIAQAAAAVKQEQQIDNLMGTLQMLQNRIQKIAPRFDEIAELRRSNQALQQRIDRLVEQNKDAPLTPQVEASLTSLQSRIDELDRRLHYISSPAMAPQSPPQLHQAKSRSPPPPSTLKSRSPPPPPASSLPRRAVSPPPTGSLPRRTMSPPPPLPDCVIHSRSPPPLPTTKKEEVSAAAKREEVNSAEQVEEDKHFMPGLRKAFAAPKLPSFVLKAVMKKRNDNSADPVICTLPPYSKM